MRGVLNQISPIISGEELRPALEEILCGHYGQRVTIAKMDRRVSDYCSSYLIEEVDLHLEDGRTLALIFKDLSENALLVEASQTKPAFCYHPLREIHSYQNILAPHELGTARYYGAFVEPGLDRYWLFIERLPPTLLWQMGELQVWTRVARWLARMHTALSLDGEHPHYSLLHYNGDFYRHWMARAREFVRTGDFSDDRSAARAIDALSSRYDQVVERLVELPMTVIHGEFFPSNILLEEPDSEQIRVCPVDWEMAAFGPGLIDLAALTSGNWTVEQRGTMASAYFQALPLELQRDWDFTEFPNDLDCCRLHQAVQLLGWSPNWVPPPEHAQNWLKEAVLLAEKLGVL